jgi:hypothetical protein
MKTGCSLTESSREGNGNVDDDDDDDTVSTLIASLK